MTKLDPDPRCVEQEAEFRKNAYSKHSFPWFNKLESHLEPVNLEDGFAPHERTSVRFRIKASSSDNDSVDDITLKRFEGRQIGNNSVIFTGGPVWAMSWVPQPSPNPTQYLASASHRSFDPTHYNDTGPQPGIIQIWSVTIDEDQRFSKDPELVMGIAHNYGKVWCMEWCPSGLWENKVTLGGLAAACSDGTIRIFKVKFPRKGRHFVRPKKIRTLTPGDENQGLCLSLSWYKGPGHKYIVGSYSSGMVSMWDISSTSLLLNTSQENLLPILSWPAHSSSVSGVSFSTHHTEFPPFCVTGGTDRSYRFWDLRDTCNPVQEVKRGMVTSVTWVPGHAAASVCHDDVYLQAHTQTLMTESGLVKTASQPIIGQNSCAWNQSVSSWLGGLAICTAAGELVVYMMPDGTKAVDQNRSSGRRRAYVYQTKLSKDDSDGTEDYAQAKEHCVLEFYELWDADSQDLKDMKEKVRYSEKMEMEDLLTYPLCSLNRVDWNPNLGAQTLLASGAQSGLLRIDSLASLFTKKVKDASKGLLQ